MIDYTSHQFDPSVALPLLMPVNIWKSTVDEWLAPSSANLLGSCASTDHERAPHLSWGEGLVRAVLLSER